MKFFVRYNKMDEWFLSISFILFFLEFSEKKMSIVKNLVIK